MPKIILERLKTFFSDLKSKVKIPKSVSAVISKYKKVIYFFIVVLLLISALLFLIQTYPEKFSQFMVKSPDKSFLSPSPTASPVSCVVKIIPKGKQDYSLSHGKDVLGPKPTSIIINPLDPKIGDSQTVSISVKYPNPIIKATATLEINDPLKAISVPMKLVSGTTTDGTWSTTWKVPGSYDCYYQIKYFFQSGPEEKDVYQGGLRFR